MLQTVKIQSIEALTHDVLHITVEKPASLAYVPGQAVDVSVNKPGWENELRPFTFTSLPEDAHIEFVIKTYSDHNGVTNQLRSLSKGDSLIIHDVFGTISYKGEGVFIAGGAGLTPFIAIFKQLSKQQAIGNNKLIFANKTRGDIILEDSFHKLLGANFVNILSAEERAGYEHGYISAPLIKKHTDAATQYFYLCGPDPMMDAVEKELLSLGVAESAIVKEAF